MRELEGRRERENDVCCKKAQSMKSHKKGTPFWFIKKATQTHWQSYSVVHWLLHSTHKIDGFGSSPWRSSIVRQTPFIHSLVDTEMSWYEASVGGCHSLFRQAKVVVKSPARDQAEVSVRKIMKSNPCFEIEGKVAIKNPARYQTEVETRTHTPEKVRQRAIRSPVQYPAKIHTATHVNKTVNKGKRRRGRQYKKGNSINFLPNVNTRVKTVIFLLTCL